MPSEGPHQKDGTAASLTGTEAYARRPRLHVHEAMWLGLPLPGLGSQVKVAYKIQFSADWAGFEQGGGDSILKAGRVGFGHVSVHLAAVTENHSWGVGTTDVYSSRF